MDGFWPKVAAAPAFGALAPATLETMANAVTWRQAASGCMLIDGAAQDEHPVFLLADGTVSITAQPSPGNEAPVQTLDAVALIGGFSWIAGEPGTTTVSTMTACTLGVLSGTTYLEMLRRDPSFMMSELQRTVRTVRKMGDRLVRLEDSQAAVYRVYADLVRLTV